MTGTTVDIELIKSCKEMKVNRVLTELYYDTMTRVPLPEYSDEELEDAPGKGINALFQACIILYISRFELHVYLAQFLLTA